MRSRAEAAEARSQQSAPGDGAAAASTGASAASARASSSAAVGPRKPGLSKLVEYPGDPEAIAKLLASGTVDAAGKDLYGLSALHKFCAWDKLELVQLLLPHLAAADINAPGGTERQTPLHMIAEMGGGRVLRYLLEQGASGGRLQLDLEATDKKGRTAHAVAVECGHEEVAQLLKGAPSSVLID